MTSCEKALNDLFNQCRLHLPNHHFSKQLVSECAKLNYDEKRDRWRNPDKDHFYAAARQLMVPVLRAKAVFTEPPQIMAGIISSSEAEGFEFATI